MKKYNRILSVILCVLLVAMLVSCGHSSVETKQKDVKQVEEVAPETPEVSEETEEAEETTAPKQSEAPKTTTETTTPPKTVTEPTLERDQKTETTCRISINCSTVFDHSEDLDPNVLAILPKDGVILPSTEVTFKEGETAFDVLLRETKNHKIQMEYSSTPAYKSAYIEGIANLYEFSCGELSGWHYRVNGAYPSYGSSQYTLKDGDVVEWIYSCDLGRDIGDENPGGQ